MTKNNIITVIDLEEGYWREYLDDIHLGVVGSDIKMQLKELREMRCQQ